MTNQEVLKRLASIDAKRIKALEPLIQELQTLLSELEGQEFGSLEANKLFAQTLENLLQKLDVRIACPRSGCGHPSTIRSQKIGANEDGLFQFQHKVGGGYAIHRSLKVLPALILVDPLPNGR